MNRSTDNWMKWWKRLLGILSKSELLHPKSFLKKANVHAHVKFTHSNFPLARGIKGRHKWLGQGLLILCTVVIISACGGTATNQNQPRDSQTASSDCRLVQHSLGEVCVPLVPQRVVALNGLDTVISLGIKPIGNIEVNEYDSYLKGKWEGIEDLGDHNGYSLESIVALKPDLILGAESDLHEYDLLSQIAPTVIVKLDSGHQWKEFLSKYAEALGKEDEAEQIIADYQARIEEFQAQMGDRLSQTEVSIVNLRQGNGILLYQKDTFCGSIVADAGLPRPPGQKNNEHAQMMNISKELLHMADGDVIFAWTYGSNAEIAQDAQATLAELKADPLWAKLNAVQQGKVYDVPSYWIGWGPIVANLILDDLFKYLVDSPSQAAQ